MKSVFPKDFLWGASSSAFQIEGGWNEDKKGMTVADFNSFKEAVYLAIDIFHSRNQYAEISVKPLKTKEKQL